jgi:hypothetical protein
MDRIFFTFGGGGACSWEALSSGSESLAAVADFLLGAIFGWLLVLMALVGSSVLD